MPEDMSGFEAALGVNATGIEEDVVLDAVERMAERFVRYRTALMDGGFNSEEAYSLVDHYAASLFTPPTITLG